MFVIRLLVSMGLLCFRVYLHLACLCHVLDIPVVRDHFITAFIHTSKPELTKDHLISFWKSSKEKVTATWIAVEIVFVVTTPSTHSFSTCSTHHWLLSDSIAAIHAAKEFVNFIFLQVLLDILIFLDVNYYSLINHSSWDFVGRKPEWNFILVPHSQYLIAKLLAESKPFYSWGNDTFKILGIGFNINEFFTKSPDLIQHQHNIITCIHLLQISLIICLMNKLFEWDCIL